MLCGATELRSRFADCPDYYLQTSEQVDYVQCRVCSLVQQQQPAADVVGRYEDYPLHSARSALQRLARRVLHRQVYFQTADGCSNSTVLDYGCGDGTFLRDIQHRCGAVYGFEPGDAHAAALSRQLQLPVFSSTTQLRAELFESVDVVTAHFVLEHADDLHSVFDTFSTVLRHGGLLYIAVPNISSWEARLFKKRWHGLDPPRHLAFPEAVHFEALAREHGFNDLRVSFAAFPNTLAASLATVLSGRCRPTLLIGLILPCWLAALAAPQGTLIIRMVRRSAADAR